MFIREKKIHLERETGTKWQENKNQDQISILKDFSGFENSFGPVRLSLSLSLSRMKRDFPN
jgi:hypothetical protein